MLVQLLALKKGLSCIILAIANSLRWGFPGSWFIVKLFLAGMMRW